MASTDTSTELLTNPKPNATRIEKVEHSGFQVRQGEIIEVAKDGSVASVEPNFVNGGQEEADRVNESFQDHLIRKGEIQRIVRTEGGAVVGEDLEDQRPEVLELTGREIKNVTPQEPETVANPQPPTPKLRWWQRINPFRKPN